MAYKTLQDADKAILALKPPVTLAQANAIAAQVKGDVDLAAAIAAFKQANEAKDGVWVKKAAEAAPDPATMYTPDETGSAATADDGNADPAADDKSAAPKDKAAGKPTITPTADSLRVELMPIEKFDVVTLELVDVDATQGIQAVVGLPVKAKDGDPKIVQTYVFTGDAWSDQSAQKWVKAKGAKKGEDWQSNQDASAASADAGATGERHQRAGGKREHTLAEIKLLTKKVENLLREVRGVKPVKAKEHGGDSDYEDDDDCDMPEMPAPLAGVTSYADLEQRQAADQAQNELKRIVYFFPQLASEILRRYVDDQGKPLDAKGKLELLKGLAAEFVDLAGKALAGAPTPGAQPEASGAPAESDPAAAKGIAFSESFSGAGIALAEGTDPGGKPLELTVGLIVPGWGNQRDNHFYPAEMLKACADKFVGAKMYESDHGPNKTTREWVSTIKAITGFGANGAPLARVVVHDPNFAERVRNLHAAGMLERMECSILASGKASEAFEQDGRKGKRVDAIDEVESVDWVTRGGAGGRALSLAETGAKGDATPYTEAARDKLLADSRLPAASQQRLKQTYAKLSEVGAAIDAERAYLVEITGAGVPFGQAGNSGHAAPLDPAKVSERNETAINAVLKKYDLIRG